MYRRAPRIDAGPLTLKPKTFLNFSLGEKHVQQRNGAKQSANGARWSGEQIPCKMTGSSSELSQIQGIHNGLQNMAKDMAPPIATLFHRA